MFTLGKGRRGKQRAEDIAANDFGITVGRWKYGVLHAGVQPPGHHGRSRVAFLCSIPRPESAQVSVAACGLV